MDRLYALLTVLGLLYVVYLAFRFVVFLVTPPRGSFTDAMALAELEEDDPRWSTLRQRERYWEIRR